MSKKILSLGSDFKLEKAEYAIEYIDTLVKYTCNESGILPQMTFKTRTIDDMIINEKNNHDGTYTTTIKTNVADENNLPTSIKFTGENSLLSVDELKHTKCLTNCSHMFNECTNLSYINTMNFDTLNVTDMIYMFTGCQSLTTLDVSNFNTSNVTSMRSMFQSCKLLTSLDLSNWDTNNVTDMGSMFYECNQLTSLVLSNFNTTNVTRMGYMFNNCYNLTSLELSTNFIINTSTDIANMFTDSALIQSGINYNGAPQATQDIINSMVPAA